jgi:hypothetical protein
MSVEIKKEPQPSRLIKDACGNGLKVGDHVYFEIDKPRVIGRIIDLTEGGMVLATASGDANVTPGRVVISIDPVGLLCAPGERLANIFLLAEREEKKKGSPN